MQTWQCFLLLPLWNFPRSLLNCQCESQLFVFFSIKLEAQLFQLSIPHLFSFTYPFLNIQEAEVTFAIITYQPHLHQNQKWI